MSATMSETMMLLYKGQYGSLYEMQLRPAPAAAAASKSQRQQRSEEEFGECGLPEYQGHLQLPLPVVAAAATTSQQQQLLCLHRYKMWWMRPVFVPPSLSNVPPETIFLLYQTATSNNTGTTESTTHDDVQEDDSSLAYQLVLPLVLPVRGTNMESSTPAVASSSLRGWKSASANDVESPEQDNALVVTSQYPRAVIYLGSHPSDPFALVQEAAEMSKCLLLLDDHTGYGILDDVNNDAEETKSMEAVKPTESMVASHLGWCTWNALYTNVTGPTIVQAVHQMKEEQKIPIRWLVIDDGWQHVTTTHDNDVDGMQWSGRLMGTQEHAVKFRDMSLKDCISTLRQSYHIHDVCCWHTLMGYWAGVQLPTTSVEDCHDAILTSSSSIPASTLYYPKFSSGLLQNDPSIYRESSVALGIGIPDDPFQFWNSYHSYLRDCGVSGVKVDAQAVVANIVLSVTDGNDDLWVDGGEEKSEGAFGLLDAPSMTTKSTTMVKDMVQRLQNAIIKSVGNNFGNPNHHIIHCMAHAPELFYFLPRSFHNKATGAQHNQQYQHQYRRNHTKPLLRAADDFYPNNLYSHGPHLVACTFNSLLLSQVARVDWDMFTTDLEQEWCVRLHAVSRCLSGGPVYVSGASDRITKSVIDWVACSDGTTLTCREAARPIPDCLLRDPLAADSPPLVIFTTNGDNNTSMPGGGGVTSGVLGLFHVAGSGQWDYDKLDYTSSTASSSPTPKIMHVMPRHVAHYSQRQFAKTEFVAVSFFSKQATFLASSSSSFEVTMEPTQTEVITFVPLTNMSLDTDVAPLGFLGSMINGAGAVTHREVDESSSRLACDVCGCGRFWWAIRRRRATTTSTLSIEEDTCSDSKKWWEQLRFEMDGVEQVPDIVVSTVDDDALAMNSDHNMPGGRSLVELGFVLVSLDMPSSTNEARSMVLDVVGG